MTASADDLVRWAERLQHLYDERKAFARLTDLAARVEARHRARMAAWDAGRPAREAALRAYEAVHARRRAELGLNTGQPIPIVASSWAQPPGRTEIW